MELSNEDRQRALAIGLLRNDGRWHEAGRFTIPYLQGGIPVWLTGRAFDEGTNPKYLQLPGTSAAGLRADAPYQTRPAPGSRARGTVIVEGPFDAISAAAKGYRGVAVGTNVERDALRGIDGDVCIALDNDEAGRAATLKGAEFLLASGRAPRVLDWPASEGKVDPSSFIAAGGDFNALVSGSSSAIDRALERASAAPLNSVAGRSSH